MLLNALPRVRKLLRLNTQQQNPVKTSQFKNAPNREPNRAPLLQTTPTLANAQADESQLKSPSSATTEFPNPYEEISPDARPLTSQSEPVDLIVQLKTIDGLQETMKQITMSSADPPSKISWCRDVLFLLNREHAFLSPMGDPLEGRIHLANIRLSHLVVTAISVIIELSSVPGVPVPLYAAEATYMRALLAATGAFPEHVATDPRAAFRGFEAAGKAGYKDAWFVLGRDYEKFQDFKRAKICFDRGVKHNSVFCLYRLGICHLLGQLGYTQSPDLSLPLLHRAASLSTLNFPHPAYLYGLLLLDDLVDASIPPELFGPYIPLASSPTLEGRKYLERAAHLHFSPAQYKLGYAYEFAKPPFPFDPLLSMRYYSLASEQGDAEASMALSKWFLCGSAVAEGFEKDEVLAWNFAYQAAQQELPSAEFALGYYSEVGVGTPQDVDAAISWYRKALKHGNKDAASRLSALTEPTPHVLSREEHNTITENNLVRKRTLAKARSEAEPLSSPYNGQRFSHRRDASKHSTEFASGVIASARKLSMRDQVSKYGHLKSTPILLSNQPTPEELFPENIPLPPSPEFTPIIEANIPLPPSPEISPLVESALTHEAALDEETVTSEAGVLTHRRTKFAPSQTLALVSEAQEDLSQSSSFISPQTETPDTYKRLNPTSKSTPPSIINSPAPSSMISVDESYSSGSDEHYSIATTKSSTLSSLDFPVPTTANWPSTPKGSASSNELLISDMFVSEPQSRASSFRSTLTVPSPPVLGLRKSRSRLRGPRPSYTPGSLAATTPASPPVPSEAREDYSTSTLDTRGRSMPYQVEGEVLTSTPPPLRDSTMPSPAQEELLTPITPHSRGSTVPPPVREGLLTSVSPPSRGSTMPSPVREDLLTPYLRSSTLPSSGGSTPISPALLALNMLSQPEEDISTGTPRPPAQRRPTTFAEMGIKYTTKAEDEGCIIS